MQSNELDIYILHTDSSKKKWYTQVSNRGVSVGNEQNHEWESEGIKGQPLYFNTKSLSTHRNEQHLPLLYDKKCIYIWCQIF